MSKILLVEDDNNLREIYGARLIAEGYEIVSAHDGEEALALAIKEHPSLILTDVMMPKISGFDMVDILRSTTETKNIRVIIMTALSQPEDQKRGEQLGADRYLVKSQVTLEDVVKAVHEVLGDKAAPAAPISQASAQPVAPPQPPQPTPTPPPPAEPQVASQFTAPEPTQNSAPTAPPAPAAPTPAEPQVNPAPATPAPAEPQGQGGNRVIQPLGDGSKAPSFQELVEQELSKEADQAPAPEQDQPAPQAPTETPQNPPQPPTPPPAS